MLAKTSAMLAIARDHIVNTQQQSQALAEKATEARRAGPNNSVTVGGVVATSKPDVTLKDFDNYLR